MLSDKELECKRYDARAVSLLSKYDGFSASSGSSAISLELRAPYLFFESQIKENILGENCKVLEIGAGTGIFTGTLLKTEVQVYATDISKNSLHIIEKKFESYDNLETKVADMESLPFESEFFDFVTSAGSLSYGDNIVVLGEINRVLKNGGKFICVDSLNHNLFYRLNRWIQYLRGRRTLSTLKQMPTQDLIEKYREKFETLDVEYFGTISWLIPLLKKIFNGKVISNISDRFDNVFAVKKSAFKFVMIAKKKC